MTLWALMLGAVTSLGTGAFLVLLGPPEMTARGFLFLAAGCLLDAAALALIGSDAWAVFALVTGAAAAAAEFHDWWNRRGRRTARALGEKSRARIRKLAGALRDAGAPLPESAR